jgi:hypothetical protein
MFHTVFYKKQDKKKLEKRVEELKENGWTPSQDVKTCTIDGMEHIYQVVTKPKSPGG